jgi:hypothetical protein
MMSLCCHLILLAFSFSFLVALGFKLRLVLARQVLYHLSHSLPLSISLPIYLSLSLSVSVSLIFHSLSGNLNI